MRRARGHSAALWACVASRACEQMVGGFVCCQRAGPARAQPNSLCRAVLLDGPVLRPSIALPFVSCWPEKAWPKPQVYSGDIFFLR